ncbi:MAG: TonB family protein [Acidobacteria bacterium]|nr:TonB family protein [Acidobacteriota bacterium]
MTRFKPIALSPFLVLALSVFVFAQNELPRVINGGVLNGKAISLPKPVYSDEAKAANIEGVVRVNVVIDESGNVISAEIADESPDKVKRSEGKTEVVEDEAVHPVLADAALQAALLAKFSPTLINGGPVKIKGVIVYNFAAKGQPASTAGTGISGGVLNGKATDLPLPKYPPAALAVRAGGAVTVQVVIGESGEVQSANAVSGHPLLRAAAVEAAKAAKFSPTTLDGTPVKVSGVLVYNFGPPDDKDK